MTFTKRIAAVVAALAIVAASTLGTPALADNHPMKPFIMASGGGANVAGTTSDVSAKLKAAGFNIAGTYSPNSDTTILVITNDAMKAAAAKTEFGAYGVAQRVAITNVDGKVQVSYTNPTYMAAAYRMDDNMAGVSQKLAATLGGGQEFGPKDGVTAKKLRRYHYMPFMEYFDEPSELNSWGSYKEAVAAVEKSLANNSHGIGKVARIDVPGKQETYFAISMQGDHATDNKNRDDNYIMSEIDFKPMRSSAHLPYEIVVSGDTAYALYARFRIAINFPDLAMMGKNSFMNIMSSPEAIRKSLVKAVGGKLKSTIRGVD